MIITSIYPITGSEGNMQWKFLPRNLDVSLVAICSHIMHDYVIGGWMLGLSFLFFWPRLFKRWITLSTG